ncbi:hypothetical protein OAA39_00015 [bacterium]|jgi:hypothetical protein|nr:hypothetical protein [bacterium]|tara:strand:- start:148 stop:537 length:390 start_codon:yes stop_codon:yes gene_type:complete
MNNKLYCTFLQDEGVNEVVERILEEHDILFNKIFVLVALDDDKTMLTYNIDGPVYNLQLPNTILVHRKKQTNTLYTINALNEVIRYLNHGVLDTTYQVDWSKFRNCLLLTRPGGFKKVRTRLKRIIEIE